MQYKNTAPKNLLKGKVAVVTGAARGIGRATALALAQEGANIVGIDICATVLSNCDVKPSTPEDLHVTQKLIEETGSHWLGFILDQRNLPELQRAAKEIENKFGPINILFANAGIQDFKPLLEMTDLFWDTHIDVNLTGTSKAIRAFAPYIIKHPNGRIIITSSTQGRHGMKNGSAYSASKWGLIGLMKSAALEFGKYGTTVNAVIPGLIDTPLTRHESRYTQVLLEAGIQPTGDMDKDEQEARKILTKRTPLGIPWINPQDVAKVVVFLASDAAQMVSGATYDVTAGDSAHYQ